MEESDIIEIITSNNGRHQTGSASLPVCLPNIHPRPATLREHSTDGRRRGAQDTGPTSRSCGNEDNGPIGI